MEPKIANWLALVAPAELPVRLIPTQRTLPDALTVPKAVPGAQQITGLINVAIPVADRAAVLPFLATMLGQAPEQHQFCLAAGNTQPIRPA